MPFSTRLSSPSPEKCLLFLQEAFLDFKGRQTLSCGLSLILELSPYLKYNGMTRISSPSQRARAPAVFCGVPEQGPDRGGGLQVEEPRNSSEHQLGNQQGFLFPQAGSPQCGVAGVGSQGQSQGLSVSWPFLVLTKWLSQLLALHLPCQGRKKREVVPAT